MSSCAYQVCRVVTDDVLNRLGALNRADFSIEKMCGVTEAPVPWMAANNVDSFDWAR
jgi:hypothetical protein